MLASIKSRHDNLSWADLIVLAGITALEDAADRWVRMGDGSHVYMYMYMITRQVAHLLPFQHWGRPGQSSVAITCFQILYARVLTTLSRSLCVLT